jgi:hypothetical protein
MLTFERALRFERVSVISVVHIVFLRTGETPVLWSHGSFNSFGPTVTMVKSAGRFFFSQALT